MHRIAVLTVAVLATWSLAPVQPSMGQSLESSCSDLGAYGDFDGDGAADSVVADPSATVGGVASAGQRRSCTADASHLSP